MYFKVHVPGTYVANEAVLLILSYAIFISLEL